MKKLTIALLVAALIAIALWIALGANNNQDQLTVDEDVSGDSDNKDPVILDTGLDGTAGTGGTTGILPFKSGASGRVLLGPTCPIQQDHPDDVCADKGYATTVQVVEKNSPKSSLFSNVETDKEGNYKVVLPPGEYSLQALGGRPFPSCSWQDITIEPDSIIEVDLSCDTGIR